MNYKVSSVVIRFLIIISLGALIHVNSISLGMANEIVNNHDYSAELSQLHDRLITMMLTPQALTHEWSLFNLAAHARQLFCDGILSAFDAVIGDTSCHIRALFLTTLYALYLRDPENPQVFTYQNMLFLTALYALHFGKMTERNHAGFILDEKTNKNALATNQITSKKHTATLFLLLQRLVSHLSVHYLQEEAQQLAQRDHTYQFVHELVQQVVYDDIKNSKRAIAPTYGIIQTLLSQAHAHKLPIMLRIQLGNTAQELHHGGTLIVLYKPLESGNSNRWVLMEPEEYARRTQEPIIVFESFSGLLDETYRSSGLDGLINVIQNLDLEKVLQANEAEHPQYAGPAKNTPLNWSQLPPLEQQRFEELCSYARQEGCCANNRRLLYTDHIYAGIIKPLLVYNPHHEHTTTTADGADKYQEEQYILPGIGIFYANPLR